MITIFEDKNMYRLRWDNGDISISNGAPFPKDGVYGFYNIQRAKELARVLNLEENTGYVLERDITYGILPSGLS